MELFKETKYHILHVPDTRKLENLSVWFDRIRQPELAAFWTLVRNHFIYPVRIMGPEGPLSSEGLIPSGKSGQIRKNDLMHACALLHCCPENIRFVVSILPPSYGDVLRVILRQGCVSYSQLQQMGVKDMLNKQGYYSWDRWLRAPAASLMTVQESAKRTAGEDDYRYERDAYLYLPDFLVSRYAEALSPETADTNCLHRETPAPGWIIARAENEFVSSFPLIQGLFRQSGIKLNGMKISAALAESILRKTTIPEALPSGIRSIMKVSSGQYFLPPLVLSLDDDFGLSVEDHVRSAVQILRKTYAAYLYPALLPHIKGFRANALQGTVRQDWMSVLGGAFKSFPDEWISLQELCDFIHARSFEPWAVGYTLNADLFRSMYLVNTISGENVLPDNQGDEIDLEIMRAMALALYGIGAAELAIDLTEDVPDTPCGQIRMVRLTALGRYAFELEKSYQAENPKSQAYFSLDEKRLIIQSLSEKNPFESLLLDTAVPIGGGKFVMSAESFLKNCSTQKDVEEKVKFFEDYIADDPPQVWKDFFRTLRQRCKPLLPVKGNYRLMQLDPANKPLVDLMLSDSDIRPLIIMAEDYRILVKKEDYERLCKLLKKHGYLL